MRYLRYIAEGAVFAIVYSLFEFYFGGVTLSCQEAFTRKTIENPSWAKQYWEDVADRVYKEKEQPKPKPKDISDKELFAGCDHICKNSDAYDPDSEIVRYCDKYMKDNQLECLK